MGMTMLLLDKLLGYVIRKTDVWCRRMTENRCIWFGHSYKPLKFSNGVSKDIWNCSKCGKLATIKI